MSGGVVVLTGGVGGAKLVLGLANAGIEGPITAIVNTGDDFQHLGLHVSPDIDTLLYTLAGKANAEQGWGRANESWNFMAAAQSLGGPTWFNLGDGDLALHVLRTAAMRGGEPLSSVTSRFAASWGIATHILPMTDMPVATVVDTDDGSLPFQHYFVEQRCQPAVRAVRFDGADESCPAPGVAEVIADPTNRAIVIAPSNPFLSIAPLLAVPGIAEALRQTPTPVVAVSPLVAGQSVKGPTSKIMAELGLASDVTTIVDFYTGIVDGLLIDRHDPADDRLGATGMAIAREDIMMKTLDDRIRVARAALALADGIR